MTLTEDKKSMGRVWLVFIPLMLFYASSYFQRTAIPGTTFSLFQQDYGFSAAQIANLTASFVYVYSFFQLVVGMLADKYSGIRIVTIAGAIFCLGVIAFPFCGANAPLLYACRFLMGLGASSLYLSLVKEADRLFGRKNYAVIIGIIYFVGYSGGLFGTLPFGALCRRFNWITLLHWVSAITFCLYLFFLAVKRNVPAAPISPARLSLKPLLKIMKMPYSWMLVFASSTMFTFNAVSNMVFGKKFLLDTAGLSEGAAEAIICGQTLVGMFALLSGGITTRLTKNKRKPLIVITPAITLATTIMMICTIKFQLPAFFYAAGMILFALAAGLAVVYPMAIQEFNSRDSMTLAAGFNNNCNYLGIAIFSPLAGLLLDHFKVPGMHNYPVEAYLWLYSLALIPAVAAFVVACFIPETGGHFLHKSYQDAKK
ncbi:MAG: MFS transporter [Lentisphaeria bacterium]|nr:MFS transporter [Lentisphaeria bacterium]